MLFFELYKITVKKVTFLGFRGAIAPSAPLDPPLVLLKKQALTLKQHFLPWT